MPDRPRSDLELKRRSIHGIVLDKCVHDLETVVWFDTMLEQPETVVEFHDVRTVDRDRAQ
jgi:hypothetical protein